MEKEIEKIMRILKEDPRANEVKDILTGIAQEVESKGIEVDSNAVSQSGKVYLYAHKKIVAEAGKCHFDPMTDIAVDFEENEAKMFMYADSDLTGVQEQYGQSAMAAILCGYEIILIELDENLFEELKEKLKEVQNIVFAAAKRMTEEFNDVRTQLDYKVSVGEGFSVFLRNVHTLMLGIETLGQGVVQEDDGQYDIINIREYDYVDSSDSDEESEEIDYDEEDFDEIDDESRS